MHLLLKQLLESSKVSAYNVREKKEKEKGEKTREFQKRVSIEQFSKRTK